MKNAVSPASLLATGFALLLGACATPMPAGPESAPAPTDPIHRHALVRPATPAPDWQAVRSRLSGAGGQIPGIEIGPVDRKGFSLQIPVADGFSSGSAEIRPSLGRILDALAAALAGEANVAIQVVGHTDSQGGEMVNLKLSIARAEAVAEHLRRRGIALERLSADGRGEADPLTGNATEAGRMRNRRVELVLRAMP